MTEEEKETQLAIQKGQLKVDAMDLILEFGGGVTTELATAEILSTTVEAIVGEPPVDGEKGNVGLELIPKATGVIEVLFSLHNFFVT